jgi:chromosome segregation ATPase
MRRIITVVSAVALTLSLFTGAAAATTLSDLEAALIAAEEAVAAIELEIEDLRADLEIAEGELADATAERDAQQLLVDQLEDDLEDAERALAEARATLQTLVEYRAACEELATNQLRNACRNPTNPEYNAALEDVLVKEALRDEAQDAVDEAVEELERLQDIVDEQQDAVDSIEDAIGGKEAELLDAVAEREAAQKAVDEYVAPIEAKHNGCRGVQNAQQQVAKTTNGKGKAAEALATVEAKLGCAA